MQAAQEEAAQQRRDAESLRGALQSQEGPWLAQVQQGVQHHVQGALKRALEAEQALDAAREAHETHTRALHAELQTATAAAQGAREQVLGLQAEVAQLRAAVARCVFLHSAYMTNRMHRAREEGRKEAEAACSARESTRREEWASMQHTVEALQDALQSAQARVAELQERQDALEQREAAAEQAASTLRARVAEERAINQRLMQRKEEIEWQLLQTLAAQRDGS